MMQHTNNAGADYSPTPCASSSFPLVDLISRWRLRDRQQPPPQHHRSANGLEAGLAGCVSDTHHDDLEEVTTAPLLRHHHHRASMAAVSSPSSTQDHSYGLLLGSNGLVDDEVPYPLPEAFLPLPKGVSASAAAMAASESEGTASKRSWLPLESDEEEEDNEDDAQSIQSYDSDLIKTYDRLSSKVSSTWPQEDLLEDEHHQTSNGHAKATATSVGCAPLLSTFCLASNSVDLEDEKLGTLELQQCSFNHDSTSRRYIFFKLDNLFKREEEEAIPYLVLQVSI